MRVNELAKEMGKTSKEVLDILQKHNQDVKSHSSNMSEDQIQLVRGFVGKGALPTGKEAGDSAGRQTAASSDAPQGETPKKKIAAVYRPQNSQQRPARSKGQQQGQGRGNGQTRSQSQGSGKTMGNSQNSQGTGKQGGNSNQNLAAGVAKPLSGQSGSQGVPKNQASQSNNGGAAKVPSSQNVTQGAGKASSNQGSSLGTGTVLKPHSFQNQEQPSGTAKPQPLPEQQAQNKPQGAVNLADVNLAAKKPDSAVEQSQNGGVSRSQNLQTSAGRQGGGRQQSRDGNRAGAGNRENGSNRDGNRNQDYSGNRGNGGNRDGNRGNGFGGNRDGNRGGMGNRDNGTNRDGNRNQNYGGGRGAGFGGNRENGRNDGGRGQGFGGNRDGNRGAGFGGNRDGNRGTGFGGNRDGNRQTGFGGNRDGNRGNGFGGNRDGNRGPAGSRDGGRGQGGFSGNRSGGASRPGQRDSGGRSFDTPIQAKPTSNRQNKNNYKNDRYDKKNVNEDGPRNKGGKVSKHSLAMPSKTAQKPVEDVVKVITLPETLTIKELADKMKMQPSVIIKKLFLQGQVVTLNSEIDFEKAEEIAMEYEVLCEKEEKIDVIAELLKEDEENQEDMVPRPPVVCVMGHVDHGKTSLLDAIRSTNVTSREAGGITQHIGAYMVETGGQEITFLDTPGHEAFTAMRMRGAKSTDIAILVVAADDGVMPQTVEAINHAKAAEVEILVAINKIDKPSANIDRVKQELSEYELVPEDWGGSTIFVPVSAHTKEGIPELLEMILLAAEVKELKANPNRKARGLVIEAELDKGKGPVATILVQKGTLRVGDSVTAGACYGKVRAMMDDKGRRVKEAGPSQPVEILGLNDVPGAGDVLMATENEKEARSYAETFIAEGKNKLLEDTKSRLSLDDLFSQIKAGNIKELPIIVKADVQGSVEAVKESLVKLSNEEVMVKVIHGGVGAINESDVVLASASNAIIIGFNVRPDVTAKSIAEREKVDLRLYRVIYQAIEDVEAAMKGMLDPVFQEQVIGHGVVRQLFKASGVGTIAGSYVTDGKFQRGCSCRITRGKEQIFEGALASLKRFKDDVKEVATGYECGLVFDKFNDLQEDDMIEAYVMVEVPR